MTEPGTNLSIVDRLGLALDRGQLPAGGPAEAAERLIERLGRPARVALLGLPGSGKTAVLNLLAGETVVPENLRLPTVLVQRGTAPRMICTLADGSSEIVDGTDLAETVDLQPALVTLECDLPALSVISLLEVAGGPADQDQRRAMTWASKRADIVVWCSTAFLPKEQMLWEGLPDQIKDNGFLFVTKTDLLGGMDAVSGIVKRIEHRAGEEFRRVLPISVLKAGLAILSDGSVDRDMFRESGASAVIAAIKSRVEMARRADADTAEAILTRHAGPPQRPVRRAADPVPVVAVAPTSVPDLLPEPLLASPAFEIRLPKRRVLSGPPSFAPPVYQPPSAPMPTLGQDVLVPKPVASVPPPAPEPAPPPAPRGAPLLLVPKGDDDAVRLRPRVMARPASPAPAIREVISPADREVVEAAVAAIRDSADRLAEVLDAADAVPVDAVLDLSEEAADAVAAILARSTARQIRRIATDLGEIQDVVLLMKLEKGPAPADDAITMLLQIRRDLETLMAA